MDTCPVVIIPGISRLKLFTADETGNRIKSAWPPELDEKSVMNEIKSSLMKMMIFRKDGGFSDKIAEIISGIAEPLSVNSDGSKKYNVQPVFYNKSLAECSEEEKNEIYKDFPLKEHGETIGEENIFYFTYDPFGDIFDIAEKFDEFISFVKSKTGKDKINVIAVSVGGAVLKAYLHKYGEKNDTGKIVNIVSALGGISLIADLFEDKLNLDDPVKLLSGLGGKAASLSSAIAMFPPEVIASTIKKSLDVIKSKLIFNCTFMWALIPCNRFDGIYNNLKDCTDSVLKEKITALRECSSGLAEAVKNREFYILCGYGSELIPIASRSGISSDGIIDISSSSLGAVCADINSKPDISECVFPDTTWFFKNQGHVSASCNDDLISLAVKIMTGDIENVYSDPSYPQLKY